MEFKNTQVEEFCDDFGIKHEFSSKYTPQQTGVVERKNKTLITLPRAMLDDFGISQRFLGGSHQHHMSCIQPGVSPPLLEEDALRASHWEEAKHLLLPGLRL
jgi:transposase InsO family protein